MRAGGEGREKGEGGRRSEGGPGCGKKWREGCDGGVRRRKGEEEERGRHRRR